MSQSERRDGSRLELDSRYHCKWCGDELPEMMVDGPIAGDGTECAPVELCGRCKAKQLNAAAADYTDKSATEET